MQNPTQYIIPILLIAFVIIKRIMRAINFQKYSKTGLIVKIVIYCIIALILLGIAAFHPISYLTETAGAILGVGLVYFAVKNILLETRKDGLYYRTHVWVEVGILALFFVRLTYRFYLITDMLSGQPPEVVSEKLKYASDPFTGFIFFLLCTYYICYYIYVAKKCAQALRNGIS